MLRGTHRLVNIIMALLVSLGGWMFVVYNYYPMTDVNYNDVPISFSGERALADRGLAVSSAGTESVRATLNQRRIDVNKYSSADIEAFADVSDCVAGDNNVKISVSGPSDTSVLSSGPDKISIEVERTDSSYMDIDVVYSADAPEDREPIAYDMSQIQAEVVCAASKLKDVRRVAAVLNYEEVGEKVKSYTAKLVALDKDGNEVPHAVIYPGEISLDASDGTIKSVSLNVPVNSKVNDNYERKYSAPDSVTVKGPKDAIDKITSVDAVEVDIRYVYEDSEIPIEYDLPEGIYPTGTSKDAALKVIVTRKANEKKSDESDEKNSSGDN